LSGPRTKTAVNETARAMRSRVQTSAGWSFLVAMAVRGDAGGIALHRPAGGAETVCSRVCRPRRPKPHRAAGWYAAAAKAIALKKASA
jgi:hypothetical protein